MLFLVCEPVSLVRVVHICLDVYLLEDGQLKYTSKENESPSARNHHLLVGPQGRVGLVQVSFR